MPRSDRRRTAVAYAFLAPALIALTAFTLIPVAQGLWLSLYSQPLLREARWAGLENFRELWSDDAFRRSLFNSIRYLAVVPVIATLSLLLALLVEPALPLMGVFRALFYIPVVTTMVVVGLTWKFLFNEDSGLINGLLTGSGLAASNVHWLSPPLALYSVMAVTTWKGLGYYMVMFIVGLKSVPKELLEAARIDGARRIELQSARARSVLNPEHPAVAAAPDGFDAPRRFAGQGRRQRVEGLGSINGQGRHRRWRSNRTGVRRVPARPAARQ